MATEKPDKTMSSRLMTMKFMQRSAAPRNVTQSEDTSPPPNKRPKLEKHSNRSQATPDDGVIQSIEDAGEQKRRRILTEQAAEAGDSKWELNQEISPNAVGAPILNVVSVGFAAIDADNHRHSGTSLGSVTDVPSTPSSMGRKSFGDFKPSTQKPQSDSTRIAESGDESESLLSGFASDEEAVVGDGPQGKQQALEGKRKRQQNTGKTNERFDSAPTPERQRSEGAKLKKLSSISSGGGGHRPSPLTGKGDGSCYLCGKKGHKKRDCPKLYK